jgi:molybdopterin-guanine dinucleotide biosynthesis protein A
LTEEYLETKKALTGIILSGGKSIRMGENKAFIEIEGVPIIHRIHTLFKNLFLETIIVTNQKDLFSNLESRIYNDLLPQRGVLGGLYTGLFFSSFQYSFCVACDMPFLKEKVIEYLIKDIEGYDVIVPRTTDGLQPLHAIYSKNCLGPIKKVIEQEKFKIIDIYPMVNVKIIKDEEFKSLDPMGESFININTPEELLYIIKRRKATA